MGTFFSNLIAKIAANIAANTGVKWGNLVMMEPYDGWHDYIKDLFNHLGFIEIFLIVASALLWTGLVPYPEPFTRWGIYLWVLFDLIMYCLDLKYGKYAFRQRWGEQYGKKGYYYTVKVGLFVVIFITILAMNPQWPKLPDSPMFAAYIMNAIMSMLFITHMFTKETIEGTSIYQAWFKFLGTLAPTCLGLMWMPGQWFVYCLAFICALCDIIYIVMLTDRYHQFGINPYNGKCIPGKEAIYADTQAKLAEYKKKSEEFKW